MELRRLGGCEHRRRTGRPVAPAPDESRHRRAPAPRRLALSPTQSTLLRLVRTRPAITFTEAQRALRVPERTLRVHVTRLVLAGLLERQQGDGSPSTLRLYPTALTHARAATHLEHRREHLHEALAHLASVDREAIGAALPALHRLATTVEEKPGEYPDRGLRMISGRSLA